MLDPGYSDSYVATVYKKYFVYVYLSKLTVSRDVQI